MLQNAPNCTTKKIFFGEACPPEPPIVNAWLAMPRVATPPPPHNSWSLLANPAYAHELLLRNVFKNPPWQTIDSV